jgi:hypothetical protein
MNAVAKQQWPQVKYTQTQLGHGTNPQGQTFPGGLDLTTPPLRLPPGALHDVLNFEVAQFGGYTRIAGYERTDGHPSPSTASYTIVQVITGGGVLGDPVGFTQPADFDSDFGPDFESASKTISGRPSIGQVVSQPATGSSGLIAAVVPSPVPYLVLTQVAGQFDETSQLLLGDARAPIVTNPPAQIGLLPGGGPIGAELITQTLPAVLTGFGVLGNATPQMFPVDSQTDAVYVAAAADVYRARISAVPGVGPVLGVVSMAYDGVDKLFAFRADNDGLVARLYRASPLGWVLVPYFNTVAFTAGGTAVPLDGDTLTQGGVTATIKRVMWQSGAWTGTAVGQFVVTAPAGGNFAAGAATTTSGAAVTLSDVQKPISMVAGGRFEFVKCNFSGQLITRRIYGCDGVNKAFEFDGETLAPIDTGLVADHPLHIAYHKNFLFLAEAASLFFCAAGNPFKWSAVDGAGEIATGDTVTGMITLPGSQTTATLGVFLHNNSAFLYGTSPDTFNFVAFNTGIGAVPYSIQNLFDTFFLDDLGVVTLKTTLNWGNFLPTTLTKNILPFIARERGNLVASSVSRERSQYRLFFGDGYALYCTVLNQQYLGAGLALFPDTMTCVDNTKLTTDDEATYAGSMSGFVYQLDRGTSFDGKAIDAYFQTAWDAIKSPRILKRFRAASIEVQGDNYAQIQYGYQLGYNSNQIAQLPDVTATLNIGEMPFWDDFAWDEFTWDGSGLFPTDVDETGTAENVRVTVASGTNYIASYTINSIIHHYSLRRGMRV